ncbi:peroxidasin homolog pxn-1-like [Haliotis rufescens]|uniref:peroxidasin homolog pxn-1-like n=1 Tax=Haliotis rufescens TaxID=6454 RepID=UPI00201F2EA0|nr:peroxidasin homolog pxn-1-like [Haliotis rufescens]
MTADLWQGRQVTMLLLLLFGCHLMVAMADHKIGGDLASYFNLTDSQLDAIRLEALTILKNETDLRDSCDDLDEAANAAGSTIQQHSSITYTSLDSTRRGEEHRLNVIISTLILKLVRQLGDVPTSILEEGFGPEVICDVEYTCNTKSAFRTADGHCNNLEHTSWGRSFIPMRRWMTPVYEDNVSSPRKFAVSGAPNLLPSPRTVSTTVHIPSTDADLSANFTVMLMQWGQFLDHDITSTPVQQIRHPGCSHSSTVACCEGLSESGGVPQHELDKRPQCLAIDIVQPDRRFNYTCMNFVRSVQIENANCKSAPAEQLNQITAYIDASQVYGSSQVEQNKLRTFVDGKMRTVDDEFLPEDTENENACRTQTSPDYCFLAGDHRVNENPGLQSIQTIFMREHNRLATALKDLNCHWGDERIFQEARKIVGAFMQKITYGDYLPSIIGDQMNARELTLETSGYSNVYDNETDASIRNAFATAAYRFGHSMVRLFLSSYSPAYDNLGQDQLREVFDNTHLIISEENRTVGGFLRGLVTECVQSVDGKVSIELTDHLFPDGNRSMDLASLNIQRARDHGIPAYTKWRTFCGLPGATDFDGLLTTHSNASTVKLAAAYEHVDDIDLWTGGLTEEPVTGGVVGPTLACLLGRQFEALRKGDRFWFEEDNDYAKFSPDQLAEIRKTSLSRIFCDNTDTVSIQENAFVKGDKVPCGSLETVDLTPWKEELGAWTPWAPWGNCHDHVQTRVRACSPCNCGCDGPNVDSRYCRC